MSDKKKDYPITEEVLRQRRQAPKKHGAEGTLKRIQQNKPLAMDDLKRRNEIILELGFDPDDIPTGPMGKVVSLVADNVLLAERFQAARLWAAETGDIKKWSNLAQRSGWRNDKAINQLIELITLQNDKAIDYEHILASDDNNSQ